MHAPNPLFDVRPDIAAAIQAKKPVVALVSAPLAHTLPWPVNLQTVQMAEDAVKQEGALLAVLAVWHGRLAVGLDAAQTEVLARGENTSSANRRELLTVVHKKGTAAITVSAGMYIAWKAGIRLLATGAIGSAINHATEPGETPHWDVSADLVELQQTPVAVVSAGARTVHHLGYTAEVLETFRVPVVGYQTDSFPTFYLRGGPHPISARADSPAEVAELLTTHWLLDGAGLVVAQQTPADVALSPDELVPALRSVETTAAEKRTPRRDLSRVLMQRLNRLTQGKALHAYQTILVANARLAAQVASHLPRG
jgi:pseudouridine-5'-phosphate glycosidase